MHQRKAVLGFRETPTITASTVQWKASCVSTGVEIEVLYILWSRHIYSVSSMCQALRYIPVDTETNQVCSLVKMTSMGTRDHYTRKNAVREAGAKCLASTADSLIHSTAGIY